MDGGDGTRTASKQKQVRVLAHRQSDDQRVCVLMRGHRFALDGLDGSRLAGWMGDSKPLGVQVSGWSCTLCLSFILLFFSRLFFSLPLLMESMNGYLAPADAMCCNPVHWLQCASFGFFALDGSLACSSLMRQWTGRCRWMEVDVQAAGAGQAQEEEKEKDEEEQ
jgi:hypothetical protein